MARVQFRNAARALAAAILTLVAAPSVASAQGELNVIQPTIRGMSVWPIHVGEMLGFFAEEGLELNVVATDASIPYTMFIASGDADLALLDSADVFHAADAGLAVRVVYASHPRVPQGIWVGEGSPVNSLEDLRGLRIGLGSDRDMAGLRAALSHTSLTIDDVETVVVGDSGTILTAVFLSGLADAFAGSVTAIAPLVAQEIRLREITPDAAVSAPAYSFVLMAEREEELAGRVCGFLRAWSKAVYVGQQDIEIIAAMSRHADGVPEQWEDPDFGYGYLHSVANLLIPPDGVRFGEASEDNWRAYLDDLIAIGEIDIRHDVGAFLDRSFLDCANDFNGAGVMAAAHAWMDDPDNADAVRPPY